MDIPKWIAKKLNSDGVAKIEEAIKEAEGRTSGEIIPVVVKRSSTIGHIQLVLFVTLMLVVYVFDLLGAQNDWFGGRTLWLILDVVAAFALTTFLVELPLIQRIFTPRSDQELQVMERAQLEFYESSINKTESATGVLIFLSVMERRAVVLADKAIADKLDPKVWNNIVGAVVAGVKCGDMAAGFCKGIKMAGDLLAEYFPIKSGDVNELPNRLVIKE